MRIAMVGTGYVGLVSGACFADFGHDVVCIDKDADKIEALRAGQAPIFEPGLSEIIANNVRAGRISFTTDLAEGARGAKAIFIAVGTPTMAGDGTADMRYVHQAAREIAEVIEDYVVVVNKSTVPVGSGDEVERIIGARVAGGRFAVVSNPEFLREGAAIEDFKQPDRVVVGSEDEVASRVMREIYEPLERAGSPIVYTTRRTAELIKYAANVFLAMKVTFINEISDLCEKVGGDVQEVARGIGLDNRIGRRFLNAGPGFGGSCFPKDTLAFMKLASDVKSPLRLVETLVDVNEKRKIAMARKVARACGGSVAGKRIALLGLTYKPNTDDMRASPSLTIIPELQGDGARIVAFDPQGERTARQLLPGVEFAKDPYSCVEGADALVVLTDWDAFRALDFKRVKTAMREPILVDLRNMYAGEAMAALGFRYEGLGKGASGAPIEPAASEPSRAADPTR